MMKGTGGFFCANPNQNGSLGKSTFNTNTPIASPKAMPNTWPLVIPRKIRMIE